MSNVSMTDLSDVFLVGGAGHGADLVQNIYGMYVAKDQMYTGDASNIGVAVDAHKFLYKPLRATSLGHTPVKDHVTEESRSLVGCYFSRICHQKRLEGCPSSNLENYYLQIPHGKSSVIALFGFPQITAFESAIADTKFSQKPYRTRKLVSEPHHRVD